MSRTVSQFCAECKLKVVGKNTCETGFWGINCIYLGNDAR